MLEQLIPMLGMSIENKEVRELLEDWNIKFPKSVTCSLKEPNLKGKIEKNCIRLNFGRGGNSKYLKPIPTTFKGGFVCIFYSIEITRKRREEIPFDLRFDMTPDEITTILGEPIVSDISEKTTTWKKNLSELHEIIVSDFMNHNGPMRTMTISFIYEADLNSMEEYEKAGI